MNTIASTGDVHVGVVAWGENGQKVELTIDNVQVVKRRAK